MQSFVREKKIDCNGDYREVDLFAATDRRPAGQRQKKSAVSRPVQRNLNDRNSKRYFIQLAEANFSTDDWSVELSYFGDEPEISSAKVCLRNFLARLQYLCRKKGLPLKWLAVTSNIDGETGEIKRMHHHLFLSKGLSFDEIRNCWRRRRRKGEKMGRFIGRVNVDALIPDADFNISGKAYYFSRQGRGMRRWSGSQNLTKPVRLPDNDSRYSLRQLRDKCLAAPDAAWGKDVRQLPTYDWWAKRYPGWRIISYDPVYRDDSGWSVYLKLRRANV